MTRGVRPFGRFFPAAAEARRLLEPDALAMVFSSAIFLFLFLPFVLAGYFVVRRRLRNAILVAASVVYYAWGQGAFLPVLFLLVVANYGFGLLIQRSLVPRWRRALLALAVAANLGLLVVFKYGNFFADAANQLLHLIGVRHHLVLPPIALPLGISFFTFHALSYVIDIHRRQAPAQRNLPLLGLYLLFFPQLVAGPIIRYHEIADQLAARDVGLADLAAGVERFVLGLAKKMLIANVVGEVANNLFDLPSGELTMGLAWLAAVSYGVQIYFDFSGYSDMAIGLAHLFGFRFPENFDYPYIAQSVTEFWRRWHLSLSRWFRDYLYIPLGGNRVGPRRVYANLIIVFLLCGLWHGASWSFVIWGLWHGTFLVIERMGLSRVLEKAWSPLRHLYCLAIILAGWVFFRSSTLAGAKGILQAMAGGGLGNDTAHRAALLLDKDRLLALGAGVIGSTPWLPRLSRYWARRGAAAHPVFDLAKVLALTSLGLAGAMRLSSGTYNPFIYFRF